MNDDPGHASVVAMTACRALALLIALCVGYPSWATATLGWQLCEGGRAVQCRAVTPEYIDLSSTLTILTTVVHVPPNEFGDPLSVEIDAMASSEVRWNGVAIGRNGVPGTVRADEVPGRYSVSLDVPPASIRPGDNRVTILLSSHHLWLPVGRPVHRIAIGPRQDADAYTVRHYLWTLATLALPACVLLALMVFMSVGRIGRAGLPMLAVLAAVIAQGLIETSKLVILYTYPWHLSRMVSLIGLTAIVGLLLVGFASRVFMNARAIVVVATGMAMIVACLIVRGLDQQSLAVFEVAMLAVAGVALPAAARRDRRAILLAPVAVSLAACAHIVGPDFLDAGYYVAAAGASVALGLAAILRPGPVEEVPVAVPAVEPTVTLRDGARHHVISPSRMVFLEADDDYCILHTDDGREVVVTMTLKAVLALLTADFVRIHRSHAINIRHLLETRAGGNGRLAELSGGIVLPIGRVYAAKLQAITEAVVKSA
ncbi:LytTR family DNA-binding domain-containing protein [Sphingomonas sp. PP-CE-1A-559]|uniref:LytR/AlgR family response regulator transcription factor n=1 Tax=Sphingomonas sp. PP-CE-1A-559 TaxID=2135657 RepID=UPI001A9DA9D9|nr:LytTR family DNA-binding domain-containing protein [Sphingomonas sp. PP-CE-1A-559]